MNELAAKVCIASITLVTIGSAFANGRQFESSISMLSSPNAGWSSDYDGINAVATYPFNKVSVVDKGNVAQKLRAVNGALHLECGADGFRILIDTGYSFSALARSQKVAMLFEKKRYWFWHSNTWFAADQKTLTKMQFSQLLKDVYEGDLHVFSVQQGHIVMTLYDDSELDHRSGETRKQAVGLIRAACQ